MPEIPCQRHLFDIPEEIAYFNCSYNSPQLSASRDRLLAGVHNKSYPWLRTPTSFFDNAEAIRHLASAALGGDAEGYAVIPAASYGLSAAARAIEPSLQKGDIVLVMAEEFPSNVLPWKRTVQETGAVLETVPTPDDGNWTASILQRIRKGVKVVALSHCHWTNGAYIDLATIGRACREVGSILVVDATQSFGVMPFSFSDIQPDFLVAAGYKWLLCPYGFGLLYVAETWRDSRPLEETWLARLNAEDFAGLVKYSDTYMPGARRFDVGEKCTSTILPGAIAALEQIGAWGVENIATTLSSVNAKVIDSLERRGFKLPDATRRSPHMFGAELPAGHTGNVVADLKARNIFISQRGNALRFAPHLHISDSDVERLLEALNELAVPH
jgi:selenocysteine lyase/cysteine desulfurase